MRRKHSKRPMTNRLSLFSSFCIWESCNLRELALISKSYPVVHYLVQLCVSRLPAVVFCRPTAFYLVNKCVSVSVTISFGVKGTIRFSLTSPQCTKRQKHFPPTPFVLPELYLHVCYISTLRKELVHCYTSAKVEMKIHFYCFFFSTFGLSLSCQLTKTSQQEAVCICRFVERVTTVYLTRFGQTVLMLQFILVFSAQQMLAAVDKCRSEKIWVSKMLFSYAQSRSLSHAYFLTLYEL